MATVTLFDSTRMQAIEDGTVVTGSVNGFGHLILTTHDGTPIDAGYVEGPTGDSSIVEQSSTILPDNYPLGYSYSTVATLTDWPELLGTVMTVRYGENRTVQFFIAKISADTYVRAQTSSDTWGSWSQLNAALPVASTTVAGILETATTAVTNTRTDAAKAVTAAGLAIVLPIAIANLASLPSASLYNNGTMLYVISMNCNFMVDSGIWVQQGLATFDTTAHRDTEYARASSAYLVQGAMSQCANDKYQVRIYYTAYNASTNAQSPTTTAAWITQNPSNRFRLAWQGVSFAANANIGSPTSTDDPSGGWDATNKRWTAKIGGTYSLAQVYKQAGSAVAGISSAIFKGTSTLTKVLQSPNSATANFTGEHIVDELVFLPGDVAQLQFLVAFTCQNDSPADSTWWSMIQESY